jgi:5'-nucleotidase
MRPLILLTNDDGYDSAGILALRAALERFADVVVCAPLSNQSASSHALTLNSVLRLRRFDASTFAIDGTPADCVYVAMNSEQRILPRKPDMVVSGMNHGPNLGIDVVYSGTAAAAREAAKGGIVAIAVSSSNRADRPAAAKLGARVAERALAEIDTATFSLAPLLNVNIPAGKQWKICATRVGRRTYDDGVIYRNDPRGREYMWIGGKNVAHDQTDGTDTCAWDAGHASVTPLSLELTCKTHGALAASVAD